jgi:hypothetical protein
VIVTQQRYGATRDDIEREVREFEEQFEAHFEDAR